MAMFIFNVTGITGLHGEEIEKNNRWERLEISSRKSEIPKEHFMQRWA